MKGWHWAILILAIIVVGVVGYRMGKKEAEMKKAANGTNGTKTETTTTEQTTATE